MWAFAPWPVAQPAPQGAHAASKGGRLKLTVVRRIGAGHWFRPCFKLQPSGGNITGIVPLNTLMGKFMGLLHDLVPDAKTIAAVGANNPHAA